MTDVRSKISLLMHDGKWIEDLDPLISDAVWEQLQDTLFQPLQSLLCEAVGHKVYQDHCGKPEHDWCYLCEQRFPGQAESRKKAEDS